jgi:hypothetical protein
MDLVGTSFLYLVSFHFLLAIFFFFAPPSFIPTPIISGTMFNKATFLFFAFFASSVLAGQCRLPLKTELSHADLTVPVPGLFDNDAPTTCDKNLITKNLAEMLQSATGIQSADDDQYANFQLFSAKDLTQG